MRKNIAGIALVVLGLTVTASATDDVAIGETPVKGTVSGDYTDTHTSNDVYESITERQSGGKPANRYSYLEHKWTLSVTGGDTVTFYLEAYKTDNTENDDFVFAYSTDGDNWTDMVTVTKISDDDTYQTYELPGSLTGTTYVRVKDTDQTPGNKSLDTIYVDHMFIRSESVTYTLTVNSGSGDGQYAQGTVVDISADPAPSGKAFDEWIGDTENVADVTAADTTITMPPSDATVTATYVNVYTLTVDSGTGDGAYEEGEVADISADAPPSGQQFDEWIGDTSGCGDVTASSTTYTMPPNDATVTATYTDAPAGTTQLIVDWGDSEVNNVYDFSDWDTPTLGRYTSYSDLGPDGLKADWTGAAHTGSVSGSSEEFVEGDQIRITWYNSKTSSLTFYPKISFDDPDDYDVGATGTWYDLGEVVCPAESTETSVFTFDAATAGSYTLVNACRYTNGCNEIVIDKYELITSGTEEPTYTLTVDSGSGDGQYTEGTVVDISADAAPSGQEFDKWIGDTSGITDVYSASTTITMPAADATITATYTDILYTLTVNSGTGDGQYTAGTLVDISADAAPSGQEFDKWIGDTSGITDVYSASTTITMPAADATITATYKSVGTYTLTVNSGTGDGEYTQGTVVDILADPAPSGKAFYKWIGDTAGIADIYAADTTITMPGSDATITAKYTSLLQETVHFREGGGEGYEPATFDDTKIVSATDDTYGNVGNIAVSTVNFGLYAVKDLFAELPAQTDGNDIQIIDAALHLYRYNQGTSSDTVYVYRVTTDWLFDAAGDNENDVSFLHAEVSSETDWASGPWSTSDYDAIGEVSRSWVDGYGEECEIDVTTLVADIYSVAANYGFAVKGSTTLSMRTSEHETTDNHPSLEITYSYGLPTPTYMLTVNSGSGDGEYEVGEQVIVTADTPPSGKEFNMWIGDVEGLDDEFVSPATLTMPGHDAELTATYRDSGAPDKDWWPAFDLFCQGKFGAEKEDLAYDHWGDTLQFMAVSGSEWQYASKTSAVVAFETNLPAKSYVEYGETTSYGSQTPQNYRYHYVHVIYLTGLDEDTTYHFRCVAEDERGNTIYSSDKTLTTATPANVVYVPGSLSGPPYTLSESGKTYLVTEDIVADGSVFLVTNSNITVDLDGHTVTYNNADDDPNDSYGIESRYHDNVNLYNGTIKQGLGYNGGDDNALGNSPVYIRSCSGGEVAGVKADYLGAQISGLFMHYSPGSGVHHCVVLDRGGEMVNRHMGCDAIAGVATAHHNLVLRGRQGGIECHDNGEYYNNEVYIDSVCTNSFGMGLYDVSFTRLHHNRIFGTGYLLVAIGTVSGCTDIEADNNFVHLHEMEPDDRWPEYGPQSGGYCCRITWGGDNIDYHDNTMITYAQDGGMVRGTWFYTQASATDVTYTDSVVKAVLLNETSDIQGCIVVAGDGDAAAPPHVYENNRVISNFCNVRLGESYGTGCNTRYYDNTFVKCGPARADYRTVQCGEGSTASKNHEFYDSLFEGDGGYDEVLFAGTGAHDFYVGWTLTVETEPYANVTIEDVSQVEVFSGQADEYGIAETTLYQYKHEPSGKTFHTPHKVTAEKDGNSDYRYVTMDAKKTVQIPLP